MTYQRPKYVPDDFSGLCKVFPAARSDGKEPVLLPYQARWVLDPARLKIGEKSRQIGWTWSEGYGLVRRKSMVEARLDAWISSRDDIQARLFLEDCKNFAAILQIGAQDLGEQVIDEKGHNAYVLALANRLRIHSMSSNPDAQAGKRGDRVLDEFALHPDPRKLYAIAYPGITWGGTLSIFSTHRGSHNYFNELIQEIDHKNNPKGFSKHRVTLQDALDQGFLYKLQSKLPKDDARQNMDEAAYFNFIRAGAPDEESFMQEYMCVPSDDASAFMTYDLIASCEYAYEENWKKAIDDCVGPVYIGVDIGRQHDLTVIWVAELFGGTLFTRAVVELKNTPFSEQEATLYPMLAMPNVRRCCIDQTGIGRQFAERATLRFGEYKIESVNFTGEIKEEMAYPLRASFEDRTIRIPKSDFIRSDFRAIKKETTSSGNIRFSADRGKNGHSDRFWAAALCKRASKTSSRMGRIVAATNTKMSRIIRARRDREMVGA